MSRFRVRPCGASDACALEETFAGLSPRSRYLRYHSGTPRLTGQMRRALLDIDGDRHVALVAEVPGPRGPRAIGIARLVSLGAGRAEVAVEVVDAWHRQGVGTSLLRGLADEAARLGYTAIHADVLPENLAMRRLLAQVFPEAVVDLGDVSVGVPADVGLTPR